MEPKVNVTGGPLIAGASRAIQLLRHLIEQLVLRSSARRHGLVRRWRACVDPVELADRLRQGTPDEHRKGSRDLPRSVDLSSYGEPCVLGTMPPKRAFEGTETDRIHRLQRIGGVEQPNFDRPPAVSSLRYGESRRKRHRVADDFVAPSITSVGSSGIGARIKNFRAGRCRREHDEQEEKGCSSHGFTTGGCSGCCFRWGRPTLVGERIAAAATDRATRIGGLILGCGRLNR